MNDKLLAGFVIVSLIYSVITIGAWWLEKKDQD